MPTISFQPTLREIKEVLKSDFYQIPRFQRPYSWTPENLDDFIRDTIDDNDPGYFIGPMVAYREGKDTLQIVDGQQRLTTLTLALCAVRDIFLKLGERPFADGLSKYIERDDDDSITHYVLRSEAAGPFLASQVQVLPPRAPKEPKNDDQLAIQRAFNEISAALEERISGLDTERPSEHDPSPAASKLRAIRDNLLELQVIWIQLDGEDDAYVIFETLNSRGKDLEVTDLMKNFVLAGIRAENGDLDTARILWNEMRERLASGSGANPNKFILHWWLSRNKYTAERKLFKLIKKTVPKSETLNVLRQLHSDAELYAKIAHPLGSTWKPHEIPLRDSLAALNTFAVRQPRPLLLAVLRLYTSGTIKFKKCLETVRLLEAYHFITTAVVGVSSTGGISTMYAAAARETSRCQSGTDFSKVFDALRAKLQRSKSERDTFVLEFPRSLYFTEEFPHSKRLVQYALRRIHESLRPHHPIDHTKCNIEHIGPQSDGALWTGEIGNLLWIDAKLNTKLGSKTFEEKRAILEQEGQFFPVDDIISATSWGEIEVHGRGRSLAELAYDQIWVV